MDFDFFKKAVASMHGFTHCLGMMGGEPTLHPEFARFVDHFREAFPESRPHRAFTGPTENFIKDIEDNNLRLKRDRIRGLFTSLGETYMKHFETIQDSFGYQCLNDHLNPSLHGAFMATRRELGIPDDEWIKLRDACWVQNLWSASITPKGAFFCEVAASMDMLLGGPGGWPVEPGWWEREPADFGDQLHWCELCAHALAMPKRDAREESDDASPLWLEKLKAVGSPKLERGGVLPFDVGGYDALQHRVNTELRPYLSDTYQRLSKDNRAVYPKRIVPVPHPAAIADGRKAFAELAAALPGKGGTWVLLHDGTLSPGAVERLEQRIFNPGCLYSSAGWQFFNTAASALRGGADLADIAASYPAEKRVLLKEHKNRHVKFE